MKVKESTLASILGPIFTVFLVFILLASSILFYAKIYLFNTSNLVKSLDVEEVIDELKDEIMDDVYVPSEYSQYVDAEEYEELIDSVFETKFVSLVLTETLDAALYGDDRIDRDALEDAFDESTEEFFDEHDEFSKSDVRDLRDTMLDSLEDAVAEEANATEIKEVQDSINAVKNTVTVVLLTLIVIAVIMIGSLLLAYKNKATVLKLTGIALTVSQGIDLVGALGIRALLIVALDEIAAEEPFDPVTKIVTTIVTNFSNNAIILFAVLLAIGIGAIVAGSILAKRFNEESIEDIEDYNYSLDE